MKKLLIAAAALAALPAFATTYNYTANAVSLLGGSFANFTSIAIDNTAMTLTGSVTVANGVTGTKGLTLQCCSALGSFPETALTFMSGPVAAGTYSFNINLGQTSSWDSAFLSSHGGTTGSALTALLTGLNGNIGAVEAWTGVNNGITGKVIAAAVPEPTTYAMLALGLGLVALRRRKQEA